MDSMNGFQWLVASLLLLLIAATFTAMVRRTLPLKASLIWMGVWLSALAAVGRPEITIIVAHILGIRRGADLVMYFGIVFGLVAFFAVFNRMRRIERELTEVVRELALREPSSGERAFPPEPLSTPARPRDLGA
jgi:hypothetical protein